RNAVNFSQGLSEGRGGSYSIFLGSIYSLFGEQRIIGQYINLLFGMFTIILLKKILENIIKNKEVYLKVLIIILFLLSFIVMMILYDVIKHRFKSNLTTVLFDLFGILFFYILNTLFSDVVFVKINSIDAATELNITAQSYVDGDSAYLEPLKNSTPIIMI